MHYFFMHQVFLQEYFSVFPIWLELLLAFPKRAVGEALPSQLSGILFCFFLCLSVALFGPPTGVCHHSIMPTGVFLWDQQNHVGDSPPRLPSCTGSPWSAGTAGLGAGASGSGGQAGPAWRRLYLLRLRQQQLWNAQGPPPGALCDLRWGPGGRQ